MDNKEIIKFCREATTETQKINNKIKKEKYKSRTPSQIKKAIAAFTERMKNEKNPDTSLFPSEPFATVPQTLLKIAPKEHIYEILCYYFDVFLPEEKKREERLERIKPY